MRPSSSPLAHSSSTPELHPVLQAALDSLDVELEEELTLYRRQRYCQAKHGKHIPAWQPGGGAKVSATRSPQLPLMDLSAEQQPQWDEAASPMKLPAEDVSAKNLSSTNSESPVNSASQSFKSPLSSNPVTSGAASFSATNFSKASAANFSSTNLAIVAALQAKYSQYPEMGTSDKTLDRLRELALRPMSADEWLNGAEQSDRFKQDLVYPESSYPEPENDYPENLPQSGFFDSPDGYSPDSYLESTEELLNSIAEETPNYKAEQESSLLNSLLTPLGIGSMLLLLLSSATLGYVIMHPSSLDLLTPQERTSRDNAALDGKTTGSDFASPLIPDAPNLAAEEFVDLNLGNLSTIPGSDSPRPLPGRSPLSASQSTSQAPPQLPATHSNPQASNPSSSLAAVEPANSVPADVPEPVAVAEPEPVDSTYVEPAPAPISPNLPAIPEPESAIPEAIPETTPSDVSAEAEIAIAPATPNSTGTYYVVTPYNGDPSLEQARQIVPQAYVRNFETGATVQLGVFSNAENAQELLQELQNQGIQAEVYQP